MSNKKAILVYTFLLVIPYVLSLALIGISFNALVLHSASLWRTMVGSVVGACIMLAVKITVERPLEIILNFVHNKFLRFLVNSFWITESKRKVGANLIVDFILSGIATWGIRQIFSLTESWGIS
ncbi:hypothetical protein JCM14202_2323 [Agrilactobacillus composti DSM 18527 = JCM 14202]|uniref:hypothetical protein n=1 Tax=Agrilactobacillus composti TaxID=398555 RepID=UPI00042DEE71|nr:hypothetical protein [Agrilactobacillus composti]GAF40426.1 hypothetical protein JCM14202_2323 [Agrilactobacillus composti DSM 18527 = JCM 14202]